MSTIYILDLKNCQEDYAAASEFVKAIEDKKSGTMEDRKSVLLKMMKKISISVGNIPSNISPRYFEQPISLSDRGINSVESINNRRTFSEKDVTNLKNEPQNIRYHLRIHFENNCHSDFFRESELLHLQYFAMLLKRVSRYFICNEKSMVVNKTQDGDEEREINSAEKELKRYLTVFMVPVTGDVYPYRNQNGNIDYATYLYVSRYLRLLSKRYTGVIYGVDESLGQPVVTSLNFRKNKKCKTCFPLIIIDQNVYESLFVVSIADILEELFLLKSNGRFRMSRDENPMIALDDFIAETDLYRIRDVAPMKYYSEILYFLKSCGKFSLMELSLFSFMLSVKKVEEKHDNHEEKYINVWRLACEICQGLKQVAQNAIQHTENKECFFSFYLHERGCVEERGSYINRITRFYPDTYFDVSSGEEALEIFVSDLNDKEDMVDNFISNLEFEWNEQIKNSTSEKLPGHFRLLECREKLAIRNFFSVFALDDAREEWKYFRQEDIIAHIGLSQFAQTARRCKASVKVISSKYSELTDEKRFFYRAYGNQYKTDTSQLSTEGSSIPVIPGTQFSILIPVQSWGDSYSRGIGQLKQQNCVAENYAGYASFLDYREKRIIVSLKENRMKIQNKDILDAKRKYWLVQKWRQYWEEKFEENIKFFQTDRDINDKEKYVFNYDFNDVFKITYFDDEDRIEVFLKGLIGALSIGDNLDEFFLIALTNLPTRFVEVFRKVCVQLSAKQFPSMVQLCLHEKQKGTKENKRVILLGNDFTQAIYNAYVLSMEHGVGGFNKDDCMNAMEIKTMLMSEMEELGDYHNQIITGVCPFDVILSCSESDNRSFFEKQLKEMAEGSLDEELIGYKLNNTHMRLGSKVHIESFYEMSFLFYRTTVANRLAFNILRQIMKNTENEIMAEKRVDIVKDNILFYGYASYSKAVLTSINEILREYRRRNSQNGNKKLEDRVAIASFQHNLMLESEETQMYYDLPSDNFPGIVKADNRLSLQERVKVIQIVPISSTLTTFDKMWKRFLGSVVEGEKNKICLAGNYTVFWVVDQNGNLEGGNPSKIEEKYWNEATQDHKIKTNLPTLINKDNMDIEYLIRSAVVWHDPLACELCYPEYVINEVPLVETDPTSTVPTQQIRYKGYRFAAENKAVDNEYDRLIKLQGCVLYDHICRRQNHYQFYIDTQQYFYNVKSMVRSWLETLNKEALNETKEPVMHIIFSPEHNTNVGFVQYVNTYYFNGLAEIVSINVDKQFRSNFICEHAALKRMIEELYRDRRDKTCLPVRFYFVDDTIITGDTLEKANGLLHSLVPENEYPVNLFSKIFVLIDRLSSQTKRMYVDNPEHNFMAFLHIDVSNVRTQGDSCIGCKLEQDARKLYKRSATRNMASYWYRKMHEYRKKAYDNKAEIDLIDKEKSYAMLLLSHILQNTIVKQGNCYNLGDCFDVVLNISLWLLNVDGTEDGDIYSCNKFLKDMRNMNGVRRLFKTVCRPFFSYDFKIKRQVYTFFIFLTELILGVESKKIIPKDFIEKKQISYLAYYDRILKMEKLADWIRKTLITQKESELDFLKDYLLEGLTDMGSTYSMRKQTLIKVHAYLRQNIFTESEKIAFWKSYEVNIHRLVTGNTDESRELWLEYMYITGMEYSNFYKNYFVKSDTIYEPQFFYTAITGTGLIEPQDKYFYQFCHNLFLQNTGINFDGLEEKSDERQDLMLENGEKMKSYWRQMRNLDAFENPVFDENRKEELVTKSEEKLFDLLKSRDVMKTEQSVNQWYENFLNSIVEVIVEKYNIEKKDINIAMLTETRADKEGANRIQLLDIVKENINSRKIGISETRYYIKERVVNALENEELFNVESNGYTISEGSDLKGEQRPYIIAFFDNPEKSETTIYKRSLTRVFLYISVPGDAKEGKTQMRLRLILRDILMYRNRILRFLEKDFAGEIYASYAHTIGERNILSHEKAHSHNTTADDEISLEIFQGIKKFGEGSDYAVINREMAANWLLLRNYTNGQIAKIFNRSFHDSKDKQHSMNSPLLYIPKESINYSNKVFKEKLDFFSKLNLKNENPDLEDGRFKLLNEIIDIQYDASLNDAEFIQGSKGQFFNLEYFKCILIDIMISAIKFESVRSDYLTRIDRFLEVKERLNNDIQHWNTEDEEISGLVSRMKASCCYIKIFREQSPIDGIDYLVIQNPVDEMANRLGNWKEQNEIILHRLEDPLDYADGHMSLIAIKRYIENIDEVNQLKCDFRYTVSTVEGEKLYFENRLPVLKRR